MGPEGFEPTAWWSEATRSIQAELRAQQVKLAVIYNTYRRFQLWIKS